MAGERVAGLWRYPVKSMQGQPVRRALVGAHGITGDRLWGVRDRASGPTLPARAWPSASPTAGC